VVRSEHVLRAAEALVHSEAAASSLPELGAYDCCCGAGYALNSTFVLVFSLDLACVARLVDRGYAARACGSRSDHGRLS